MFSDANGGDSLFQCAPLCRLQHGVEVVVGHKSGIILAGKTARSSDDGPGLPFEPIESSSRRARNRRAARRARHESLEQPRRSGWPVAGAMIAALVKPHFHKQRLFHQFFFFKSALASALSNSNVRSFPTPNRSADLRA